MKNSSILMIAYSFPPAAGIGTFRITKFCKYLKKLGYNPIIVSPSSKCYSNIDKSLLNDLDGIKRYELNIENNLGEKGFYTSLVNNLDLIYQETNFKYAFITGGPFSYLKIGPYLKEKYGTKYIVDFRDPWSLQKTIDGSFYKRFKNIIYKRLARFQEAKIFSKASYITMVNDTMTNDYSNLFPKYKDKIITLPNAIDLDDYKASKPYKYEDSVILYAGKFSTASGFRDPTNLLLAMKEINKIKFVHIGQTEQRIVDIVKSLDCENIVEFYGNKSYKDTISLCKGANILVILSTNEKSEQTGKIYDYLGCERNILAITNKNNEIYKICKQCNILTANPNDSNDIKNKINELLKNKNTKYQIDGIDTREKMTKKLIELFESIEKGDKND